MQLIEELEAVLGPLYAVESRHGYSADKLIREGVHFFVARADGKPVACGGVQFYPGFGELKRMYVRDAWRGRGLGHAMLEHLAGHARANACTLLRLETGIHQHEAIKLYEADTSPQRAGNRLRALRLKNKPAATAAPPASDESAEP